MENYGSFKKLAGDKKGMSAEEAYIMLKNLGLLGQEFVPGATSIRKLMEGKPREAIDELQDWIPGNAAYQNFISGKNQDWGRNAIDLTTVGIPLAKPLAKGAKKAAAAIEKMPKGGREGFIRSPLFKKLTPAEQAATDDYITYLNTRPDRYEKIAGVQTTPEHNEFLNPVVEEFIDDAAGNLRVTRKPTNKNVRLEGISPEHTGDAAYFRHRYTNYDAVEDDAYDNFIKANKAGKMPRFDDREYYDDGKFEPLYYTKPYGKSGVNSNLKGRLYEELDNLMPGTIDAVEGRGPSQKDYQKIVEAYNRAHPRYYMLDSYESPIYKMESELKRIEERLPNITDPIEKTRLQQRSQKLRNDLNDWNIELILGEID